MYSYKYLIIASQILLQDQHNVRFSSCPSYPKQFASDIPACPQNLPRASQRLRSILLFLERVFLRQITLRGHDHLQGLHVVHHRHMRFQLHQLIGHFPETTEPPTSKDKSRKFDKNRTPTDENTWRPNTPITDSMHHQ